MAYPGFKGTMKTEKIVRSILADTITEQFIYLSSL